MRNDQKVARASRPPTVMTCGCIPRQQSQFTSGWRCNDDQLTLMSMTWPKTDVQNRDQLSQFSRDQPGTGPPRSIDLVPEPDARVSRTGLAAGAFPPY